MTFPRPAFLTAAAALLAGCAAHPVAYAPPPAAQAATLRIDAPTVSVLKVYPDGAHCGAPYDLSSPDVDPLQRVDRMVSVPAGQPIGVRVTWPTKYLKTCTVVMSFTPVAGGRYRLGNSSALAETCEAFVEAVPGTKTAPVSATVLRNGLWSPDSCNP